MTTAKRRNGSEPQEGDKEYGHTAENWDALHRSPAMHKADEIHHEAADLLGRVKAWIDAYGGADGPGVAAIEAAGVPVPEYVREQGTGAEHLPENFRGIAWALLWVLRQFADVACGDLIPVPSESDADPAEPDPPGSIFARMARCMLSPEGARIMQYIADRGPIEAKAVAVSCGVERSKCYVLLSDLRERGLIRDDGRGYAIAEPDLWAAVSGAEVGDQVGGVEPAAP